MENPPSSFRASPFSASRLVSSSRPDDLVPDSPQNMVSGVSAASFHGDFAPSLGNLRRNGENAVPETGIAVPETGISSLQSVSSDFPSIDERRWHYAANHDGTDPR